MLLREKVILTFGGGRDEDGVVIPPRNVTYRADVAPLSSQESYERGRNPSSVSYRVTLGRLKTGDELDAGSTVFWRGSTYQVLGPPEQFTVNGRAHHVECIITRATG